ncbi:MAG: PASTA domain-containing protein [Bacilli bacterium]|nr:PASTA domain-containing protein [Bacilli bacterium]
MNENDKLKEKLDLLSALKEDEEKAIENKRETVQKTQKKEVKEKKKKEKVPKNSKPEKVRSSRTLLTIISFVALVSSLSYLIYTIFKATDQMNQPYLIITSVCLFIICAFMVLTGFTSNKKIQKNFEIFGIVLVTFYTAFQFLVTSNVIVLPTLKTVGDFSNVSINEVVKWANKNHITLEQTYEYSDSIESDYVISQNIPANTLVKEVKTLEVVVSNGPNYESIVSIPNMVGWNIDDVVSKIKELKLNHVNIEYNFNEAIEKDIAYEQDKSGEIRRNEEITIKFSLGNEADLKPVNLKDLIDLEEFDAILWLKRNGIKYEISYEFSNDIKSGNVISTTPESGTLIHQSEITVQVVISKGPKIIAPDLMKMSLEEITEWAIKNKLVIIYESEYNSEIKAGEIIRVSVKEGDTLEENDRIYIITSKGTLKMISITDGDITSLRNFAIENKLTLSEESEFSDTVEKGKFISISKKPGEEINPGEEFKVVISLGSSIELPNFIGMSANKAQTTCKNLGITCKFSYVYSSKTKGNVFNQSMSAGSKVISDTTIVLTVSNGPKPNNGSSSNNGNSGGSTTPTCVEKSLGNLTIQEGWLIPGNSSKTISSLQSKLTAAYPNAKFNIVTKEHNSMNSGLVHPSSPSNNGTPITSCKTYTIYIVE